MSQEILFSFITESKAFRNEDMVERYSIKELGEILFTMLITLHLLSLTRFSREADDYAHETMKYPLYERIYLSNTDLGNVISTLKNASDYLKQRDVDIPVLDLKRYLRGIRNDQSFTRSLFYKLQTRLKIQDAYLFAFRRDIIDTEPDELSWEQKKTLGHRLYQQLRRLDYKVDLLVLLQKFMDCNKE